MEKDFYRTDIEGSSNYFTAWEIYPKLLKKIKIKKGDKILDAGCGNGELSKYLKIPKLYGFDLIKEAIRNAKKTGRYKKVVKEDIYKLSFKDKEFDKTICVGVFQYLKYPEKAFKELVRITKKEIIVTVANFDWFKIKSIFSKEYKKRYLKEINNEILTNTSLLKNLARQNNLKVKIIYLSNKAGKIRNVFGKYLASEVVAIYDLKWKF